MGLSGKVEFRAIRISGFVSSAQSVLKRIWGWCIALYNLILMRILKCGKVGFHAIRGLNLQWVSWNCGLIRCFGDWGWQFPTAIKIEIESMLKCRCSKCIILCNSMRSLKWGWLEKLNFGQYMVLLLPNSIQKFHTIAPWWDILALLFFAWGDSNTCMVTPYKWHWCP